MPDRESASGDGDLPRAADDERGPAARSGASPATGYSGMDMTRSRYVHGVERDRRRPQVTVTRRHGGGGGGGPAAVAVITARRGGGGGEQPLHWSRGDLVHVRQPECLQRGGGLLAEVPITQSVITLNQHLLLGFTTSEHPKTNKYNHLCKPASGGT